jgi:hypothetical protein
VETVPKPTELLALHDVTGEMFDTLRQWFDVPTSVALDLTAVDSAVVELGDPVLVAAMAMRKLQALHLLSTPGVRTTTDVVVNIVQDLQRALLQAPHTRLRLAAESTDWDAELALLEDDVDDGDGAPATADERDPEADRFRELHGKLLEAMEAVIRASDGSICYLV